MTRHILQSPSIFRTLWKHFHVYSSTLSRACNQGMRGGGGGGLFRGLLGYIQAYSVMFKFMLIEAFLSHIEDPVIFRT